MDGPSEKIIYARYLLGCRWRSNHDTVLRLVDPQTLEPSEEQIKTHGPAFDVVFPSGERIQLGAEHTHKWRCIRLRNAAHKAAMKCVMFRKDAQFLGDEYYDQVYDTIMRWAEILEREYTFDFLD